MANICAITGKKPMSGNNVSHSVRRTRRRFLPNLQKKAFIVNGRKITLKISAKGLRILDKADDKTRDALIEKAHKESH